MDTSLQLVQKLVEDFKAQEKLFLSPSYQESQARQDFIDKFFTALGWDVTHDQQRNPYQQEVKIENKVSMATSQRRADYAFSISPNFEQVKFFVEAKKPSRSLSNADDYFQTIRYAWNTRTPISVLTDFEEFHILDCRYKPNIKNALDRKIASYHYSDYLNNDTFAKIFHLFGREAVATGSLEKFTATLPKKATKTAAALQPVDDAFLEDLDEYRVILAKAFKKTNEQLQGEELTEAVQRTIDRLVFIRFLEDKGIEDNQIIRLDKQATSWKGFLALCKRLEPKYNGLVFKPHRILDSGEFNAPDDKAFAEICRNLSDPSSPYDFNQIPISILGSIYERFLGKVVNATDKRVKVEEKPEVRKAGGVYYTPQYIVKYIVKETVGKLIEGKTPAEISKMAFADIACGSGSFLIEVYDQLLEYHVRYYSEHPEEATSDQVFFREGILNLALKKKKEILLNNIYGVDIDYQATEVTQLSLYLKMLEDATMQEAHQFGMFKERILPDLRGNIVCGNSLIGRDIVDGQLFPNLDEAKLRPMNFEETFPQIIKRGGFDAIVGNPPYIRIQTLNETSPEAITYFKRNYKSAETGNYDIYVLFVERALSLLARSGVTGYILPHKFFNAQYGHGLRKFISDGRHLTQVVHFGDSQIFSGATTYVCLMFLSRLAADRCKFIKVNDLEEWNQKCQGDEGWIATEDINDSDWNFTLGESADLMRKLSDMPTRLKDVTSKIFQGLVTSSDAVYLMESQSRTNDEEFTHVYSKATGKKYDLETEVVKPLCKGARDIRRYSAIPSKRVLFPYDIKESVTIGKTVLISPDRFEMLYPNAWSYLTENAITLRDREKGKMRHKGWYGYVYPKSIALFGQKKILTPSIASSASFTLDIHGELYFVGSGGGGGGGYGILLRDDSPIAYEYVLALLNSKVCDYYLKKISSTFSGGYYAYNRQYIEQIPIRIIDREDVREINIHDSLVTLVNQILETKEKLSAAITEAETNRLERLCNSIDQQIDEAVYALYGLTEDEIRIVEGEK
jgi:type I restriction-modification system DNA methylase subunit